MFATALNRRGYQILLRIIRSASMLSSTLAIRRIWNSYKIVLMISIACLLCGVLYLKVCICAAPCLLPKEVLIKNNNKISVSNGQINYQGLNPINKDDVGTQLAERGSKGIAVDVNCLTNKNVSKYIYFSNAILLT